MKKLLVIALMAALVPACRSKPPVETAEPTPVTESKEGENGVGSQAMKFDPTGSDSGQIAGLHTINFDYDKSTINNSSRELLMQNATWMKNNPKSAVQVEGHCDERGSVEYNFALGEKRARATKDYLVSLGVEGDRLKIISYGKEKPIDKGDTDQSYAKNRRANFVPLPQ